LVSRPERIRRSAVRLLGSTGASGTSADKPSANNGLSIAAFALGGISILFFPIIFGPAAIICAGIAKSRKEKLGNAALAVAIGGMVLGFILGALAASAAAATAYAGTVSPVRDLRG
jgi:hypothetical protein